MEKAIKPSENRFDLDTMLRDEWSSFGKHLGKLGLGLDDMPHAGAAESTARCDSEFGEWMMALANRRSEMVESRELARVRQVGRASLAVAAHSNDDS